MKRGQRVVDRETGRAGVFQAVYVRPWKPYHGQYERTVKMALVWFDGEQSCEGLPVTNLRYEIRRGCGRRVASEAVRADL
ncbi:MAG TPA: hypothetical protein VG125_13660 [Pirellulales bacterium]|jgi:hypothetical protein|nr:hypothetical protein [Pirellulales bacterium]